MKQLQDKTKAVCVSVMMPAFNSEVYIAQAIESVLGQSFRDWELIIVNDGSTDNTGSIAEGFRDERIRVVHQQNSGEATARNVALSLSKGEFIAFLDADDLFLPDHLEKTIRYLQSHPHHSGIYTDGYYCDEKSVRLEKLSTHRIEPVEGHIYPYLVHTSSVFGPPLCVVLRREAIARHGLLFDPEIVIGPDWDFFIRLSEFVEFGFLELQTCLYRIHETNITVKTGSERRLQDLARCRTKAILMSSFQSCPLETRQFVFYDLLINLLGGSTRRQQEITNWMQFQKLPTDYRARLLRLMAADALRRNGLTDSVFDWMHRSRILNPRDWKGALLMGGLRTSPLLSRILLRMKYALSHKTRAANPFNNISASPI